MSPDALVLPEAIWPRTLELLARYRRARVEGGCLWYGRREGARATAMLIGVPKQANRMRNFEIPSGALAELNLQIPDGLVVVAQLHLHPGPDTRHSTWDDQLVVSQRVFSLVLPNFGAPPCSLGSAGIHTHDGRTWTRLPAPFGLSRVRFSPTAAMHPQTMVDTR
jgi:hypothetical protein